MIHNSLIEKYRCPLGAITRGDSVRLRLFGVPEYVHKVSVELNGENYHDVIPMKLVNGVGEAVFALPDTCEVLWYYFDIYEQDHVFFYGARPGRTQGEGQCYDYDPLCFQLTLYDQDFDTPRWMSHGIMYQIFPDRFFQGNPHNLQRGARYHRGMGRKIYIHDSWEERPIFAPLPGEKYYDPCDFYGGDLEGIILHLDELSRMGVTCIYLNPIGESASNHRYNTSDYKKVDPILGTNRDFIRLCTQAKDRGIQVILDGVYSHTGDDSKYFNKKKNYPTVGAYQGSESKYYDWYNFHDDGTYDSWWGFESLPEVNELNPKFLDYVITGKKSVIHTWTARGASGFRLDVADELPDEFIFKLRKTLKEEFKDYALIGEVWEDATTKESYGTKRKYALGEGLDSTMNYPLKVNIVNYLLGYKNAYDMKMFLLEQQANYPMPMYYALMNLLSSHDIPRIRTTLATGMNETYPDRDAQIKYQITSVMDKKGAMLTRLAVAIQFSVPGMPSVYYGDEYGMNGLMDPFNREPMYRRDEQAFEEYIKWMRLRSRNEALQTGYATYFIFDEHVLGILRFIVKEKDVFGEPANNRVWLMLVNAGNQKKEVTVDVAQLKEGVPEDIHEALLEQLNQQVVTVSVEAMDYQVYDL